MSILSERLKYALSLKRNATQADLAKACGLKPPSIWSWFAGETKSIKGSNLLLAAEYLGVRPKWLAEGIGPMRDRPSGSAVQASEEPPIHMPTWPFKTINEDEWKSIPASARNLLEQQIKSLVPPAARQKIRA